MVPPRSWYSGELDHAGNHWFVSSCSMRLRSSFRTLRKAARRTSSEPLACEGSGIGQCSLAVAPGKNGHASLASSQTVITWSKGSLRYRSRVLDSCPDMSMPISSIALMASGLTLVASVPALVASKRSPARCLSSPSAIWLLAELWVHRNRILFLSPKTGLLSSGSTKIPRPGPDVADGPRWRDRVGMPRGLHNATGHVAARAGDDELGVEADPAQGRRGEGGLEG